MVKTHKLPKTQCFDSEEYLVKWIFDNAPQESSLKISGLNFTLENEKKERRMKKPIAYLAGPLGFSEAGRLFYNQLFIPLVIKAGFEIRDPWVLTPMELLDSAIQLPYGQRKKEKWSCINSIIGHNNMQAIKESDIIIAILDGVDVDSGTAAEIGFGSALGKTIIGYRGDFRLSADNEGSIVNLQVEYFIYLNGGEIVTSAESLETILAKYRNFFQK